MNNDDYFFKIALNQAKKAYKKGNVPVGCVIVRNNNIIAKSYNVKNSKNISVFHAEIIAIIKACKKLKTWILSDCVLYVTLEPCEMCMNAIAESRIKSVKYLVKSNYNQNLYKNYESIELDNAFNSDFIFLYNSLLTSFFNDIRK